MTGWYNVQQFNTALLEEPISHVHLIFLEDYFCRTSPHACVCAGSTPGSWELYNQPSVCPNFALMLVVALQAEVSANTSCTVTGVCVSLDLKAAICFYTWMIDCNSWILVFIISFSRSSSRTCSFLGRFSISFFSFKDWFLSSLHSSSTLFKRCFSWSI